MKKIIFNIGIYMLDYQKEFIELALSKGILKFGSFVLKSGRVSPYFFNAGLFKNGNDLLTLGKCYARAIVDHDIKFDVLFGPAYKGIPLACATAMALALYHNKNVPWCFNRKEAKDHGEGGNLVGSKLEKDVLLVDDVITAGTAIKESDLIIKANNANFKAVLIALNRMEKGQHEKSAIDEVKENLNIDVYSIIDFNDLINFIKDSSMLKEHLKDMEKYREQYGV